MKKFLVVFLLLGVFFKGNSQQTSVEKSIFGIQVGLLGIYGFNEFRLTNPFALRVELGLEGGIEINSNETVFALAPVIAVEPRWYYNLNKRVKKSRRIDHNSGNFISLYTRYHPNWFVLANDDVEVISDVSFIPTWGIRRNIGKHFNYEAGMGIGYAYIFYNNYDDYLDNEGEVAVNLLLRIGYHF